MSAFQLAKGERDHQVLQEGFMFLKKWVDAPMMDKTDYFKQLAVEGGAIIDKYPDSLVAGCFVGSIWDMLYMGKEAIGTLTDEKSPWDNERYAPAMAPAEAMPQTTL